MHVFTRGNGKQILFEQRDDYICYLRLLRRSGAEANISVCAFCLMENHVHLIVYDEERRISEMMRILGTGYSRYFNEKYKRTGHLFEGRFSSVPIESEDYLLTVFRYVLNNPRKANICDASVYPWSSYSRYGKTASFVDTSVFTKLIGSKEEYETFIAAKYEDLPELEERPGSDEWARLVIIQVLNAESGTVLQTYDRESRDEVLRLLKQKGLTIRQIERLTGISRGVIQRA